MSAPVVGMSVQEGRGVGLPASMCWCWCGCKRGQEGGGGAWAGLATRVGGLGGPVVS